MENEKKWGALTAREAEELDWLWFEKQTHAPMDSRKRARMLYLQQREDECGREAWK